MKAKDDARGLLTHAASGFRERGIAGSLAWDPTPSSGLGPSLTLRRSVGVSATGGVEAVLYSDTVRRLSANDDGDASQRLVPGAVPARAASAAECWPSSSLPGTSVSLLADRGLQREFEKAGTRA